MIYTIVKFAKDEKTVESVFSFDNISSSQEQWSAKVAKTTVESGFPISDHTTVENPTFSLSGTISSYSLHNPSGEIYWNGEDFVSQSENNSFSFLEAKAELLNIFRSRSYIRLFESTTNSFESDPQVKVEQLRSEKCTSFPNCVITGVTFSMSSGMSSSFDVQMTIEQLNIASTVTVQLSESEKQPRLFGYSKQSTPVSSSQTTSNSTTGTVGSSSSDEGKDNKTATKKTDDSFMQKTLKDQMKEGEAQLAAGRYELEIREQAEKATAITGYPHRVIDYGDGGHSIINTNNERR